MFQQSRRVLIGAISFALLVVAGNEASAQLLQRPTYRSFSTTGSVFAPDYGRATLAGVKRGASGYVSQGIPLATPLRNYSHGYLRNAGSASVHVTIIDLRAMDEAILAQGARRHDASKKRTPVRRDHSVAKVNRQPRKKRKTPKQIDTLILGVD